MALHRLFWSDPLVQVGDPRRFGHQRDEHCRLTQCPSDLSHNGILCPGHLSVFVGCNCPAWRW